MEVAVWDTYVKKEDGSKMHFDIVVPKEFKDASLIYAFGEEYLLEKQLKGLIITSEECKFCHISVANPEIQASIIEKGYHIIELDNCY